jgi:ribosomal protein S18 acetylase RimI-like enzyme
LAAAHCAAPPRRRRPVPMPSAHRIRHHVEPQDPQRVRRLAESTGFFNLVEVAVAEELVTERIAKGPASGYNFVFVDLGGRMAGYACYGPVPLTASGFDLYWIVVAPDLQGQGIGRLLIQETERLIRQAGGSKVYIETSGRDQYEGTHAFYRRTGYQVESRLDDFYAPGDAKVIFSKKL